MTTQKHDQTEDAAFAEFLEGRGELVKQLKKLSQLSPSAALDAAILASAKAAVAQAERSKLTAANDAVSPAVPGKPGFLSHFRMPMALAASVMVAVLVGVMWHQSEDLTVKLAEAPEPAPAAAEAAAPSAATPGVAQADVTARAKSLDGVAKPAAIAPAAPAPAAVAKPAVPIATAPVVAVKPAAPVAPAPVVAAKSAAPAAELKSIVTSEKKADMAAVATGAANDALKREHAEPAATRLAGQAAPSQSNVQPSAQSSGKLASTEAKAVAAPSPAAAAEPAKAEAPLTAVDKAKAWLSAIEEMSKYDSRREAASAQLERFEKSYPHYPVPETLRAKLSAAKN